MPRRIRKRPDCLRVAVSETHNGYVRGSAISEAALASFRETLGVGSGLTADDLFHFVYGELHVPAYRRKYAANLQMQKELPRIPNPTNSEGFWTIVRFG